MHHICMTHSIPPAGLVPERPRQVATKRDAPGWRSRESRSTARRSAIDNDRQFAPPSPSPHQCQSEQQQQQRRRHVLQPSPGGDAQYDLRRTVLTQFDDQEYDPIQCDQAVAASSSIANDDFIGAPATSRSTAIATDRSTTCWCC